MKKQFLLSILVIFLISCNGDVNRYVFQDQKTKKWGYKNRDGEVILEPIFDQAEQFSEGLALVRMNGNNFYIDKFLRTKIDPPFDSDFFSLRSFSEGVASFKSNSKRKGYINTDGEDITGFKNDEPFDDKRIGGITEEDHQVYFFDTKKIKKFYRVQRYLDRSGYNMAMRADEVQAHVIFDNEGEITCVADSTENFFEVGQGLFVKSVTKDTKTKYVICKASNGDELETLEQLEGDDVIIGRFTEGILITDNRRETKVYNTDGELLFSKQQGAYRKISDGLIEFSVFKYHPVTKSEERYHGYADFTGKTIIEPDYYVAHDFENGIALTYKIVAVTRRKRVYDKWYIDKTGKRLFQHSLEN